MGEDEYIWSKTEKQIARRAFDSAYKREMDDIQKEISQRINSYKKPKDLWTLHDFLTLKRDEIDEKYDYRYSVLIMVFTRLLNDGYLRYDDLVGLSEAKIQAIQKLSDQMGRRL